jgi:FkbM family methyltransferase
MGVAMKENPVIVMALYDIGRENWNSFGISYNTYLVWMRNTLSLKSKFVIYTENKFSSKIKEYRKEFDPNLEDTIIIEKPIEELYYHKNYYKKLSDLMFSDSFKKKNFVEVPEMTEPLYNIIMFNKLEFLRDANEKRYFENDLLIWADAGGLRESIENYKDTVWPCLEKINQLNNSKITFFSHSKNIHVNDEESHALSQVRYIQGTSFIVPSELINELAEKFETTVKECISQGYIGSDEKIFDITYCKDPDKYNLIKCTWRTYFKILKENSADLFDKNGNQSSKVFIDLGSYECGSVIQKIDELDIDRSWEVHAFEPNPLVDTQKYADKIKCCKVNVHKKAIWKRSGKVIFNQYGENGKSQGSLIEETGEGKSYGDYYASQIIESVDLLEFIRSFDDNKEIYIFMDIEHAECEIFEHMIKNGWPKNIKKIWVKWHSEKIQIPNSIKDVVEEIKK